MDGRFSSPFLIKQEDSENSAENSEDSPRACMFNDNKIASTSSPKRSTSTRRAIQKRVVCVPIKDVDGSRLKGEVSSPPSDSWAWRKYGQKPIKGSPYPRGYYRCSSSKGCPARKQVERSRDDPHMLVVTYSCEHNHPWPTSRNNRHNNTSSVVATPTPTTTTTTTSSKSEEEKVENLSMQQEEINSEAKFSNLGEAKFSNIGETHEFGWLSDFECTSSTMLENPILSIEERVTNHAEMNMFCSMREEDESLFADLGELPEYSMVFRHGMIERDEERRGQSMTPWCGTIG